MTLPVLNAVTIIGLCCYILILQMRWARREQRAFEERLKLILLLERRTSDHEQEEVSPSGEQPLQEVRGEGDPGERERLGEEERRKDGPLVD